MVRAAAKLVGRRHIVQQTLEHLNPKRQRAMASQLILRWRSGLIPAVVVLHRWRERKVC